MRHRVPSDLVNQSCVHRKDLAERAGAHRTYVGMVERCEKNVTIHNIQRIAEALEVAPDILLRPR
jgi:transcriptional regulator with XRE-family HTH domain